MEHQIRHFTDIQLGNVLSSASQAFSSNLVSSTLQMQIKCRSVEPNRGLEDSFPNMSWLTMEPWMVHEPSISSGPFALMALAWPCSPKMVRQKDRGEGGEREREIYIYISYITYHISYIYLYYIII